MVLGLIGGSSEHWRLFLPSMERANSFQGVPHQGQHGTFIKGQSRHARDGWQGLFSNYISVTSISAHRDAELVLMQEFGISLVALIVLRSLDLYAAHVRLIWKIFHFEIIFCGNILHM